VATVPDDRKCPATSTHTDAIQVSVLITHVGLFCVPSSYRLLFFGHVLRLQLFANRRVGAVLKGLVCEPVFGTMPSPLALLLV